MASWRKQSLSQDPKDREEPMRQRQGEEENRKSILGRGTAQAKAIGKHVVQRRTKTQLQEERGGGAGGAAGPLRP